MATALRNLNEEEENVVEALEQTVFFSNRISGADIKKLQRSGVSHS
jgi:hypothetical protein